MSNVRFQKTLAEWVDDSLTQFIRTLPKQDDFFNPKARLSNYKKTLASMSEKELMAKAYLDMHDSCQYIPSDISKILNVAFERFFAERSFNIGSVSSSLDDVLCQYLGISTVAIKEKVVEFTADNVWDKNPLSQLEVEKKAVEFLIRENLKAYRIQMSQLKKA